VTASDRNLLRALIDKARRKRTVEREERQARILAYTTSPVGRTRIHGRDDMAELLAHAAQLIRSCGRAEFTHRHGFVRPYRHSDGSRDDVFVRWVRQQLCDEGSA
jgi:hypothetical protein